MVLRLLTNKTPLSILLKGRTKKLGFYKTWISPDGCEEVDVFLVGGGGGRWGGDYGDTGASGGSGIVIFHYFKYKD